MIKASVLVPVYNAGRYLDLCAGSLLKQSLSPDEYEIVFVDDGSTDDSPFLLDRLADEYSQVRVHHQPNSGWPGRPRNVGIDLARGEYVQFVDQDDELWRFALERMYEMAVRNGSDIVLGKVAGTMAGPSTIFRQNVERCTIADSVCGDIPLIESLTPHKMFRRSFLLEHNIRFAEGRRHLEDQLFMVQAYLAAANVSIVGDYPCYFWRRRDDGGNLSKQRAEPRLYYASLRDVLDAVVEGTEPGQLRARLLRRFYRNEMLGRRLHEPLVLQDRRRARRAEVFHLVRDLVLERFAAFPEVADGLSATMRLRSALLLEGRLDGLVEFGRRCAGIKAFPILGDARWEGGVLCLDVRVEFVHADESPVVVERRDDPFELDPALVGGLIGVERWDVGDPCAGADGEVQVHDRAAHVWWHLPGRLRPRLEPLDTGRGRSGRGRDRYQVVLAGTARLDPLKVAGGCALEPGVYTLWVRARALGIGRKPRLGAHRGRRLGHGPPPAILGDPARIATPNWTRPNGHLNLEMDQSGRTLNRALALRRGVTAIPAGDRDTARGISLRLPIVAGPDSAVLDLDVLVGPGLATGQLRPDAGCATLTLPATAELPDGRYEVGIRAATTEPRRTLAPTEGRHSERPARIAVASVQKNRIVGVQTARSHATARLLGARLTSDPRLRRHARRAIATLPPAPAKVLRRTATRVLEWMDQ